MSTGKIILITGGARSGKSGYAQSLAEQMPGRRTYLATCPVLDDEMAGRVKKHRNLRAGRNWRTVEEQTDMAGAIGRIGGNGPILVDCLTLWINNLIYAAERAGRTPPTERTIASLCKIFLSAARRRSGPTIFVSNEVGMGIVPDSALGRLFRDLAGRCNQVVADQADHVVFMVSGQPVAIKGQTISSKGKKS